METALLCILGSQFHADSIIDPDLSMPENIEKSLLNGTLTQVARHYLKKSGTDEIAFEVLLTSLHLIDQDRMFFRHSKDEYITELRVIFTEGFSAELTVKAIAAINELVLKSHNICVFSQGNVCQFNDKYWRQCKADFWQENYHRHCVPEIESGVFSLTRTIVEKWKIENSIPTRVPSVWESFLIEMSGIQQLHPLEPFFVIIFPHWMNVTEDLLKRALPISSNIIELVLPFELFQPNLLFSLSSHLCTIQTPTRTFQHPSRSPEKLAVTLDRPIILPSIRSNSDHCGKLD